MDLLKTLPLGLYLEQPVTWLHKLDPRVKLAWLMSFLFTPILANSLLRIGLVLLLILITLTARIPLRVWKQQMGWLLILSTLVFILSAIAPDGLTVNHQPRLPDNSLTPITPTTPQPTNTNNQTPQITQAWDFSEYNYILFKSGPFTVSRRSLELAIRVSTLLFTLIYSTNLFLLTTAPEEITTGIESLMQPLRRFNWPVTEIALTLTLSLRFIPLVLEEIQNLVRSIWTRAINWKKLGIRKSIKVWLMVAETLLQNLLLRAEQISSAMKVRGFTSPNQHQVKWHQLRFLRVDWLAMAALAVFWGMRVIWGNGTM
ncbi:energy-coupling factor transporter transmembrane protein EcfT [Aerosakkonemataceae cyanobacterium BLCC-F154]|uniref:Energy-coupling factor transporter transmembrane protein EcfT n=1 Tax=Floridaenema fluviatile BLCC-F154 TaxID=3153640 RepID=A0ABV4Y7H9_9CYAN